MGLIAQADLKRVIQNPKDPESMKVLVQQADKVGMELKSSALSTSQIRALFGEVRQIQSLWSINSAKARNRLILLKPKMAYRARKESTGRADSPVQGPVSDLVGVLDPAIDLVIEHGGTPNRDASIAEKERFDAFVALFEAILAYHRFHGGK